MINSILYFVAVLATFAMGRSANLTDWSSHGETFDEQLLTMPAIDDALIAEINAGDSTWTAGRNARFEGLTVQDAKVLMGVLQDVSGVTVLPPKQWTTEELENIPDEFDWRTDPRAKNCPSLTEIRDQANCGSCWAFGSVEAMTDRRCIARGTYDDDHLSAQDVTSCCGPLHGDMGCNGGIPSSAYQYYHSTGVVTGGNYDDKTMCYSYELAPCAHHVNGTKYPACTDSTQTPKCARSCVDDHANWQQDKKFGQAGYSVCQQSGGNGTCAQQMAADIFTNGPITGMFFVHQDFLNYQSGVYQHKGLSPMLGGHAIKILGYGTEDGTPYWLVANSWNDQWGDKGYFKIKRGHNECQIEDAVINGGPAAGIAKLD